MVKNTKLFGQHFRKGSGVRITIKESNSGLQTAARSILTLHLALALNLCIKIFLRNSCSNDKIPI